MTWCTLSQGPSNVVPAECITYLRPDFSIRRWTSAICEDTEGEEVPIGIKQKSAVQ